MSREMQLSEQYRIPDFTKQLSLWFDKNARMLPWRKDKDPYHVWVSEIMLQQTRIEAVIRYYERFMDALPDIFALASCQEAKLLKLWEGLGYYNRARNLQRAAIQIVSEYGGVVPASFHELVKLPGFGPYTAGAVASICFDEAVPAVDGNVLRVLSRITADPRDVLDPRVKKERENALKEVLPLHGSGVFNQALMELGERICVANGMPDCKVCPIAACCKAYSHGLQSELPVRIKKTKRKIQKKTVLIIRDQGCVAIRKRPGQGLLAGFYEPLVLEGWENADHIIDFVRSQGFDPLHIKRLPDAKHIFTHLEWHMQGYLVRVADTAVLQAENNAPDFTVGNAADISAIQTDWRLVPACEIQQTYPIPGAYAAYGDWMQIKIGADRFENGEEI